MKAGNKAPTWDHNRNWQYIVLRTDEEKEYAFSEAKAIADQFNADRYLHMPRPYPITLGQKMYGYAMPKQYTMLKEAPYVVIPLFKSKRIERRIRFKIKSLCHDLVRNRKYFFSGNGGRTILFHAYTAE